MAGEEPFDMFNRRNSTDCHQYENKEQYNILDQLREVLGSQIEASNKIIQFWKQTNLYKLIYNKNYKS